jgi:hypothetical protein
MSLKLVNKNYVNTEFLNEIDQSNDEIPRHNIFPWWVDVTYPSP